MEMNQLKGSQQRRDGNGNGERWTLDGFEVYKIQGSRQPKHGMTDSFVVESRSCVLCRQIRLDLQSVKVHELLRTAD